jgi:hypothetical protein
MARRISLRKGRYWAWRSRSFTFMVGERVGKRGQNGMSDVPARTDAAGLRQLKTENRQFSIFD